MGWGASEEKTDDRGLEERQGKDMTRNQEARGTSEKTVPGSEKSIISNKQVKEAAAFVFGHWKATSSLAVK